MFRSFDSLRLFCCVADSLSMKQASERLNLSKGAVSHQVAKLEAALGFKVFERQSRGLALTQLGHQLYSSAQPLFASLEDEIGSMQRAEKGRLVLGTTTYFASRWLSPRMMRFVQEMPQATMLLEHFSAFEGFDDNRLDVAIVWGHRQRIPENGVWLLDFPCFPVCGSSALERAGGDFGHVWRNEPLVDDVPESPSWTDWFPGRETRPVPAGRRLMIQDPNVRVAALLAGNGIALMDDLVAMELEAGALMRLSDRSLDDYGYVLLVNPDKPLNSLIEAFVDWIRAEAKIAVEDPMADPGKAMTRKVDERSE